MITLGTTCFFFILGRALNIATGSICQIIAYALQAPAPPFPVFVLSFVINGVGMAIQVYIFFLYLKLFMRLAGCTSERIYRQSQEQS
jgi:hypothetical protein